MAIDYIRSDTAPLYQSDSGSTKVLDLLWGDRIELLTPGASRSEARARGRSGFVSNAALGGSSLLEIYFIDVGQGDGILIRTPDHRHLMIDGGYSRSKQPTGKNAADFVDWKFFKDYGLPRIQLDAMIASHCDADHYGGLWDLLNAAQSPELDVSEVRVEEFYHAGVSWWNKPGGGRWLGPHQADGGENFFIQLLSDRASAVNAIQPGAAPKLQGEWGQFIQSVTQALRMDNSFCGMTRLNHTADYLPGFEPAAGQASIKVLAPVEFVLGSQPAVRRYGSQDSWNTNGNSILLRLDYGRARILLTGDLNSFSHESLLRDYAGERQELECDVAKACHHGSEEVSYEFLQAMRAAATVICSGDAEGNDHPRPTIVAASATSGYPQILNDRLLTPLVYSTELARSVSFGHPTGLTVPAGAGNPPLVIGAAELPNSSITFEETKAGDLNPKVRTRKLNQALVVAGLIYGLVNVRTDGEKILCATLNEKDYTWQVKTFSSRF